MSNSLAASNKLKPMNVLRDFKGKAFQENFKLLQPCLAVQDEPLPGLIRQAQFGPDGLLLISGKARAFVPLRELFKLAEGMKIGFARPPKQPASGPSTAVRELAARLRARRS